MNAPQGWGYGIRWQLYTSYPAWYERVGAALGGICHDWLYNTRMLDARYTSTLWCLDKRVWGTWDALVRFVRLYPTRFYLILNEPEHPAQCAIAPTVAAANLRELLRLTGMGRDFAVPGCELSAPGRAWFEEYLNRDGPLGTALHIHLHRARNGSEWTGCLEDDIAWLDAHGALWDKVEQCERPLLITETSANSKRPEDQMGVMDAAASTLRRRGIHAVYWYASCGDWPWTNLVTADGDTTRLGAHWLQLAKQIDASGIFLPIVYADTPGVPPTSKVTVSGAILP